MTGTGYEVPVPVVRYQCPFAACTWVHDAPSALPVAPEGSIDEQIRASMLAAALVTEETVKAHLETHSLLEWVHEVARLRKVIDLTAIALSDSGQIGAFIRSAVAPGSPVAAVRRECLERLR